MYIKTKISKVNNETLATLGLRVIDTVNESGVVEALNSKHFLKLVEVNAGYQQAINPLNVKYLSSQVDKMFVERNRLFMEMITFIKGLTVSDDADIRNAALKIWEEITKFGLSFSRLRKADKTLRYILIIESLKLPEYADAILKTNLADKLSTLDAVQREYEMLYMGRGNRVAGKVAATNVRNEMEKALKKHLDETAFLCDKHETDEWKTLYANLKKRFDEVSATYPAPQNPESPAVEVTETETA